MRSPWSLSYGHLRGTPFHTAPQRVWWDKGKKGYKTKAPDLKRTKPAGTPKGKSCAPLEASHDHPGATPFHRLLPMGKGYDLGFFVTEG